MNIASIKKALNVETLDFVAQTDENGDSTPWISSWDNDTRVRVSMHNDVASVVFTSSNLFLKTEEKVSNAGIAYTQHLLCVSKANVVLSV